MVLSSTILRMSLVSQVLNLVTTLCETSSNKLALNFYEKKKIVRLRTVKIPNRCFNTPTNVCISPVLRNKNIFAKLEHTYSFLLTHNRLCTLSYRIIVQQILLIFCKIPTCTPLFHPARLLILGNFEPKPYFALVKNEKFQPARPYSILHVY